MGRRFGQKFLFYGFHGKKQSRQGKQTLDWPVCIMSVTSEVEGAVPRCLVPPRYQGQQFPRCQSIRIEKIKDMVNTREKLKSSSS